MKASMALPLLPILWAAQEDWESMAAEVAACIQKPDKAVREKLAVALRGPARGDAPGRSVWRAIRTILDRAHDPKTRPIPEELDLLANHLRALPVSALKARDGAKLAETVRELGRANPTFESTRLLAKAYFDELVEAGADVQSLEELGRAIGVGRGTDSRWVDRSGELVWQLRGHREAGTIEHALAAERFKKGDDFSVAYARAVAALHGALQNKDLFEEASKAFADAKKGCPVPEHPAVFSKALKAFVLCKRCAGEGFRDCTICKATGERTAVCGQCDGAGKLFKGVSGRTRQPVIENCSACDAKGKWQIKCTTCNGEKRVKCPGCKEPFSMPSYEQLVIEEACAACDGKGTPFRALHTPCAYCFGQGRFLIPKAEPKSRLPAQE